MSRDLISPEEASLMLGVTTRTLARYAEAGALWATWTPGGHRRYDRVEIQQLAASLVPDEVAP